MWPGSRHFLVTCAALALAACDPPAPMAPIPPATIATTRRPLPEACVTRMGALTWQLALSLQVTVEAQLGPWTPEDEAALGAQALARALARAPRHDALEAAAAPALDALRAAWPEARWPHRLVVLDLDAQEAEALPGGVAVISRGLIEARVQDEAQLAFVIAHELAHAELGHASALHRALAALSAEGREVDAEALALARHGVSAASELEADRLAVVVMHLAGYDGARAEALWRQDWPAPEPPLALLHRLVPALADLDGPEGQELLRQLAEAGGQDPAAFDAGEVRADLLPMLATHPPAEVRACVCRDTLNWMRSTLPPGAPWRGAGAPWPGSSAPAPP